MSINEDKYEVFDFEKSFDKMNEKYDKIDKERQIEWDKLDRDFEELHNSITKTEQMVKNSPSMRDEVNDLKKQVSKIEHLVKYKLKGT